jgi:hypothetical protein
MPAKADTKVRGRLWLKRCGPSHRRGPNASAVLKNFVRRPKKTFSTWGNSGIEPDKGKGISSPGMYEAILHRMWIDGTEFNWSKEAITA